CGDAGVPIAHHGARARAGLAGAAAGRVLAAGYLQALASVRELHGLWRQRLDIAQHDRAAVEHVRRAGKDLHGHDARSQSALEHRILRPDGMFDPDPAGIRAALIAGVAARRTGAGAGPDVSVRVDDARRDPAPGGVDDAGVRRHGDIAAHRLDP